jgi:hypothetical protein
MTYIERIVKANGEILDVPYNEAQLQELKNWQNEAELQKDIANKLQNSKSLLLSKLGITEDEARLLLA